MPRKRQAHAAAFKAQVALAALKGDKTVNELARSTGGELVKRTSSESGGNLIRLRESLYA